jgi:hypothetical protein
MPIALTMDDVALVDARVVSERVSADSTVLHHIATDGSTSDGSSIGPR